MALGTAIAFGDVHKRGISGGPKGGYLLPDQEYYNLRIRPEEEAIHAAGEGAELAMKRGAEAKGRQFMTAQGLGGSLLGQKSTKMSSSFLRVLRRMREAKRREAEELRRRRFAERDQMRAEELQKVPTVAALESAALSTVPYAGQYLSGATQAVGGLLSLGLAGTPDIIAEDLGYGTDLDVYDPEDQESGDYYNRPRYRGGGGRDFPV